MTKLPVGIPLGQHQNL